MIIDDEKMITESLKVALEYEDKNCVVFNGCASAREYYKEHSDDVNVILIDYTLPHMTGCCFIKSLDTKNKKIIYMTGHETEQIREKHNIPEEIHILQKPFTIEDVLEIIEE